jgi:RNA polymerase sigma factor (sigma-70 family)
MVAFDTLYLQGAMAQLRAGDPAARDALIRPALARLEALARKMLHSFPGVQRWEETSDVLQKALMRLLRALEETDVATTRDYFRLAATMIRRELIDLARHYKALGQHYRSGCHQPGDGSPNADPAEPESEAELDRWTALHEAIEALPGEEREVFCLTFYHGLTQNQIAALFNVSDRTVRNWYYAAIIELKRELGDVFFADR